MVADDLQVLLDKQAIMEQIYNYGRSMDRLDAELGKAVFHPEAKADYGAMYQGSGYGFIEFTMKAHLNFTVHSHQFSNILIHVNGNTARSETYGDVNLRRRDDKGVLHDMRNLGRYIDVWEKRDGAWRILDRKYIHDMDHTRPADSQYQTMSKRDKTDACYLPGAAGRAK
jgi:hypothetical protein